MLTVKSTENVRTFKAFSKKIVQVHYKKYSKMRNALYAITDNNAIIFVFLHSPITVL
jgi:hypothetical protein